MKPTNINITMELIYAVLPSEVPFVEIGDENGTIKLNEDEWNLVKSWLYEVNSYLKEEQEKDNAG